MKCNKRILIVKIHFFPKKYLNNYMTQYYDVNSITNDENMKMQESTNFHHRINTTIDYFI